MLHAEHWLAISQIALPSMKHISKNPVVISWEQMHSAVLGRVIMRPLTRRLSFTEGNSMSSWMVRAGRGGIYAQGWLE